MSSIDHPRLKRLLQRCDEIANEPNAKPTVSRVFKEVLKPSSDIYLAADSALPDAETAVGKERREAIESLRAFDPTFREARSVVLAFVRDAIVPNVLSAQTTDTDRMNAVRSLLDVIEGHNSEGWAKDLLEGDFGQKAPNVLREVQESIAANKSLFDAQQARAHAFGPAYENYLAFKDVVRNAYGPSSRQYRRIHIRLSDTADDKDTKPEPEPSPTPPNKPKPPEK